MECCTFWLHACREKKLLKKSDYHYLISHTFSIFNIKLTQVRKMTNFYTFPIQTCILQGNIYFYNACELICSRKISNAHIWWKSCIFFQNLLVVGKETNKKFLVKKYIKQKIDLSRKIYILHEGPNRLFHRRQNGKLWSFIISESG